MSYGNICNDSEVNKGICKTIKMNMSKYTSMHTGGEVTLAVPISIEEVLIVASRQDVKHVIGCGTNLLVADIGIEGIVLSTKKLRGISCVGTLLTVKAGEPLPILSRYVRDNGLSGLEFCEGIPGSVGGGIVMNAGAFKSDMADIVNSALIYRDGNLKMLDKSELGLHYRGSALRESDIVLEVQLNLQEKDPYLIDELMNNYHKERATKQPHEASSGSIYKSVEGISAAYYIEQAGLKGFSIGGAMVSPIHSGFIVNTGGATTSDVLKLMKYIEGKVFAEFGVELKPEVKYIE